eukprot:GHVP01047606.1.p1 GENE.GHVP01047606.1~~GHVP01047606.1.p1  ORF type:complete len:331 (+),score=28.13 GHVP01047606.1:327-1319(+)
MNPIPKITKEELAKMTEYEILGVDPYDIRLFTIEQISWMSKEQLEAIFKCRYNHLLPAQLISLLSCYTRWIRPDDFMELELINIPPVGFKNITASQVLYMTDRQAGTITKQQFSFLRKIYIKLLSHGQIKSLNPSVFQDLTLDKISEFTCFQMQILSADQLNCLNNISMLSEMQIRYIRPNALASMDDRIIRELTPGQMSRLTKYQVVALLRFKRDVLRDNQIGSIDLKFKVSNNHKYELFKKEMIGSLKKCSIEYLIKSRTKWFLDIPVEYLSKIQLESIERAEYTRILIRQYKNTKSIEQKREIKRHLEFGTSDDSPSIRKKSVYGDL